MKIGIDIGGSHIAVALIKNNKEIVRKIEKDLTDEDKNNIEKSIENIIIKSIDKILKEENLQKNDIEKIGIAAPGEPVDGKITKAWNLKIVEYDITSKLREHFPVEISLKNDAKSAGLCEKTYGSIKEFDDAIFLCLGTGIGGAVFQNRKMLKPKNCSGFEVGHMIIKKDGEKCNCGQRGCFERYASIRTFKEKITKKLDLSNSLSGYEILTKINENRELVEDVINEYIHDLSIGLINLINIFSPEAITIGGSFAFFKDIFLDRLKENLKQNINGIIPEIKVAEYINDAGIIGSIL